MRLVVFLALLLLPRNHVVAQGTSYTPQSSDVVELVRKGLDYLATADHTEVGAHCLAAICFLNAGASKDHPKVVKARNEALAAVGEIDDEVLGADNYNAGLIVVFLCMDDPRGHSAAIAKTIGVLTERQKSGGGWGYPDGQFAGTGDTSQTQYVVLAYWYAQAKQATHIPYESLANGCNWLIRTQDPNGGWGYQGHDPGTAATERLPQEEVRHSLVAAGLSSVYLCANALHLTRPGEQLADASGARGPLRLASVDTAPRRWSPRTRNVGITRLRGCMRDGDAWFDANFRFRDTTWMYYYMYAYERYRSFREIAEGRTETSPDWYNTGVTLLKELQRDDGAWEGTGGANIDTSFALLFLQRSTQISLLGASSRDGRLTGGRGLPTDVAEAHLIGGKIVGSRYEGTLDDLLIALESAAEPSEITLGEQVTLSAETTERIQQIDRLRRLVSDSDSAKRLVAIQLLATTRSLDDVPYLIYGLGDPDRHVSRAARDGLRRLTRRLDGTRLAEYPTREETLQSVDDWKAWYRGFRPKVRFLDERR